MDVRTALALCATIVFWASAFVGIRIGLHSYSPGALALFRYLVASAAMIPVYFLTPNRQKVQKRDWPRFFVVGVAGFTIYNIALNHGEISVPAGIASFIVGLMPVFTVLLAVIFLKEAFNLKGWIGLGVSIIGIILIAIGQHAGVKFDKGVIDTLIATISGAIFTVSQKPLLKRFSPSQVGSIGIWIGTFFLLSYAPALYYQIQSASIEATLSVIYMGIFPGALAYFCWSYTLSKIPASRAATYLYVLPIVTTVLGYLILSELPALYSLFGGVIALIGAYIVRL